MAFQVSGLFKGYQGAGRQIKEYKKDLGHSGSSSPSTEKVHFSVFDVEVGRLSS